MTLEEIKANINLFIENPDDAGLVLYPVLTDNNGNDYVRIADISPEAAEEFKIILLEYLQGKFLNNPELHFVNLTDADNRKNTAYSYDLLERPTGLNVLDEVLADGNKPQFSFNDDDFEKIKGFVITLGTEENTIALYKRHHRLSTLKADTTLGIFRSDHRFVKMDEDIIKLSKTVDFLQIGDDLIVTNLKALEDGFGYEDVIRGQATRNIQAIAAIGLLDDIAPLIEMAEDLQQAKHIMRIKPDSPVMQLPVEAVIQFVQTYKPIMKKFKLSDDGKKLKLHTHVSRKLFLALMNDDLLTSELTKLYYEGLAKDKIEVDDL